MYLASQAHNITNNYWRHQKDKYYAYMVKKVARAVETGVRQHHTFARVAAFPKYPFQSAVLSTICEEYKAVGYKAEVRQNNDAETSQIYVSW